jgi:hypothetical protein
MKSLPFDSLEIDLSGRLLVRPQTGRSYEHTYREADGLQRRAPRACESARWQQAELLRHIAAPLSGCRDEELVFVGDTSWTGASEDLQEERPVGRRAEMEDVRWPGAASTSRRDFEARFSERVT